jgi:hypothetical protein
MFGNAVLLSIKDKEMSENIMEIIKCFVEKLNPVKIFLFGSFAAGMKRAISIFISLLMTTGMSPMFQQRPTKLSDISEKDLLILLSEQKQGSTNTAIQMILFMSKAKSQETENSCMSWIEEGTEWKTTTKI